MYDPVMRALTVLEILHARDHVTGAELAERLRRPFTNQLDPMEIGRHVSARLVEATANMIDAASHIPHILHLHYQDVVTGPMAAVRKLYRHCGFGLSEIAAQRMAAFLEQPHQRSPRQHDLAEFGLDAGALRECFADYVRHFAVPEKVSVQ